MGNVDVNKIMGINHDSVKKEWIIKWKIVEVLILIDWK